jgi:hypothetical protein
MLVSPATAVEEESDINVVRLGLDLPAAAASAFEDIKQKFTNQFANQRQWREFVSAVQCSVNYPAAINSLRSGTKWFSDGLAQVHAFARTLHNRCR